MDTMKAGICMLLLLLLHLLWLPAVYPQAPPPPPAMHGSNGNQPAGNGAPIGSGIVLLAGLFASYGVVRYRNSGKMNS